MKFNWEQSGMPASLVSRMGLRNEFSEFKSVLNDAQNQVLMPVDVESMARELVQAGGREFVEMVRELSAALANARNELEDANRRYERLTSDLRRRGIDISEDLPSPQGEGGPGAPSSGPAAQEVASPEDSVAEWEEWDRRFQSLLNGAT